MDVEPLMDHPAKFSPQIMEVIETVLWDHLSRRWIGQGQLHGDRPIVLDPFAGIGGIHDLRAADDNRTFTYSTYAIEIEPEWAGASAQRGPTWCGDWLKFRLDSDTRFRWTDRLGPHTDWLHHVDAVVTSCTYGNRMADHHEARDTSKRLTYRHRLGRKLTRGNSGGMQWGDEYQWFHRKAWLKVRRVLDQGGGDLFVLNVKDHVRKGQIMRVAQWHRETVEDAGFECVQDVRVPVKGMRMGANHDLRVGHEHVFVFRRVK